MGTHVRTRLLLIAAAVFLAAPVLTAAPASAAPALTKASCTAQGGTFARSKGVKTCTTVSTAVRFENPTQIFNNVVMGPFPDSGLIHQAGYYGEWKQHEGYIDTIVQTQKGSGPVVTTTANSVLVYRSLYNVNCWSTTDGGFSVGFAYVVECEIAGVYPAEIPLS